MNFTAQYMNIFLQLTLTIILVFYSTNTSKQLKQSREETKELKKQVSLLLQQTTTE